MAEHRQASMPSRYAWFMFVVVLLFVLVTAGIVVLKMSGEWRPNDAARLISSGVSAYRDGRHREAVRYFEDARRYAPENPVVYVWSAQTKLELGALDEALADVERAIDLFPGQRMTLLDLKGDILTRMGAHQEAISSFRMAIAEGPRGYWKPWLKLGRLLEKEGDRSSAEQVYRDLLRANPDSEEAKTRITQLDNEAAKRQ